MALYNYGIRWADDDPLPPFMQRERNELIAAIESPFVTVTREGGVTWGQAVAADMSGEAQDVEDAKAVDNEACWQELVDHPTWNLDTGSGGWAFLDPIGYRYYLPAAMIRVMKSGYSEWLIYSLTLSKGDLKSYSLNQWSLLDRGQRLCVKRFLEYISVAAPYYADVYGGSDIALALKKYWAKVE